MSRHAAPDTSWRDELARLGFRADDFVETFARSSGPGGQNVNKVSTSVTLRHGPSGLSVTVEDSRSQLTNRRLARARMLQRIREARETARQQRIAQRALERRRNSPRPRSLKRRIRESKERRSVVKKLRSSPGSE
jgi:protein subunit release factor B